MAQVTELHIQRSDRWAATPGVMSGKVIIENENGRQEVRLSAATIAAIFEIIRTQVSTTARDNANQVANAISEASSEAGLLENKTIIENGA